jgi:hypothetical protein
VTAVQRKLRSNALASSALPGIALSLLLLTCCALLLAPRGAAAATLTLSPGQSLAATLAQAGEGDTIEIAAGSYPGQVGVITQKRLTLRGVGGRPVFQADGRSAEGKGILVVRDGNIRVENIEFRGARVADRNGAGIRFERGHLQVVRCAFVDNENGILTASFRDAELSISDSDFSLAPADTPLPHLLYVGQIAKLSVTGSRFSGGRDGHLLKSRARVNDIRNSRFVDGPGGQAAYELEFPNGGLVTVVGNVIGQSATTSNPTVVSYGTEGYDDRPLALVFTGNTVVNEAPRPALFLRVRDADKPFEQKLLNNRFYGPGDTGGATALFGNTLAPLSALGGARP